MGMNVNISCYFCKSKTMLCMCVCVCYKMYSAVQQTSAAGVWGAKRSFILLVKSKIKRGSPSAVVYARTAQILINTFSIP